ncbi:MAG TPA: DNA polymerase A family protein, partial [Candidatus Dormibacteraeota bacterium]|nr:DNA polymerase A family protein [Candidatus Dormibacteraeota bacterium]
DRLAGERDRLAAEFLSLTTTDVILPVEVREPTGEYYKNGNPKMHTVERPQSFHMGAAVSNDRQVSRWAYEELKVWPTDGLKRNGTHSFPVDKETLERFLTLPGLGGRLAQIRLDWSWRDKLVKTYLTPLLSLPPQYADGLLHTSLHLTGTQTQRFSSSNPNLQNVPSRTEEGRAIRKALIARPGWRFIIYDYSQIELRIMAHLSRDPEMMACYWLDLDIHQATLDEMLRTWAEAKRVNAKTTNFSTIYRISPPALAVKMRVSVADAERSIEAFFARFAAVGAYHTAAIEYARTHGYARTIDGFRRPLDVTPKWNYKTRRKDLPWHVANEAINTPIQGSAAGLCKKAMLAMWRRWVASGEYGVRVNLAGQEHDAIIVEAREDFVEQASTDMKTDMESALTLRVPIVAEGGSGPSWGEAKAA